MAKYYKTFVTEVAQDICNTNILTSFRILAISSGSILSQEGIGVLQDRSVIRRCRD